MAEVWEETLRHRIKTFLLERNSCNWLHFDIGDVYVRKGHHMIEGRVEKTFDVANIRLQDEHQRRGHGDTALDIIDEMNPYDFIFIENVMNWQWAAHLEKSGWAKIGSEMGVVFSFYRRKST